MRIVIATHFDGQKFVAKDNILGIGVTGHNRAEAIGELILALEDAGCEEFVPSIQRCQTCRRSELCAHPKWPWEIDNV